MSEWYTVLYAEATVRQSTTRRTGIGGTVAHIDRGDGKPICGQYAHHWRSTEGDDPPTCRRCIKAQP